MVVIFRGEGGDKYSHIASLHLEFTQDVSVKKLRAARRETLFPGEARLISSGNKKKETIRDSLAAAGDPGFRDTDRTRSRCLRILLRGSVVYFRERERERASEVRNTHTHGHTCAGVHLTPVQC